ncbi:MAG: arylamine N-acetyltransferase [Chloroflexota bacterium]
MSASTTSTLDTPLTDAVLAHLGCDRQPPTWDYLDVLVSAYTRRVPWESASRIARRAATVDLADCPRWPDAFWNQALTQGTGGTCYESNYAFFALLRTLGFEGYLTINNMGDSIGCHSAIVIEQDGARRLVDVGLPVHLPVPLDARRRTRETPYHTYTATPYAEGQYRIERDRHPRPDCFILIDRPIADADYRRITTNDYGENGLFLDRVIAVKVVGDRIWRFDSEGRPFHLESFVDGAKTYHFIGESSAAAADAVSEHFGIMREIIVAALARVIQSN